MSVTENLIQQYTDIDAVIACNDESALGAVQALTAANMSDVLVCGFDGSVDATNAVKEEPCSLPITRIHMVQDLLHVPMQLSI